MTALHHACKFGQTDCCRLLLDAGAAFAGPSLEGCDPLDLALTSAASECVTLLVVWKPQLLPRVVAHAKQATRKQQACKILWHICQQGEAWSRKVVVALAEATELAGQEMFCTTTCGQLTDDFACLNGVLVQTITRICASSSVPLDVSASMLAGAQRCMESVWGTLEEWLLLLKEDAASVDPLEGETVDEDTRPDLSLSPPSVDERSTEVGVPLRLESLGSGDLCEKVCAATDAMYQICQLGTPQ